MGAIRINERVRSSLEIQFAGDMGLLRPADQSACQPVGQPLGLNIARFAKRLFLFLPGSFLLFHGAFSLACFLVVALLQPVGGNPLFWFLPFAYLLVDLVAAFMVWFGLGDRRNKRHLAIPGAIAAVGTLTGLAVSVISLILVLDYEIAKFFILMFPVALIAAMLAKGWIDLKD